MIGISRDYNAFKAIDCSLLIYSNWKSGIPTDQSSFDCVEIAVNYQGEWIEVKCEKKNAVLCEKKQEWSNSKIEIGVLYTKN